MLYILFYIVKNSRDMFRNIFIKVLVYFYVLNCYMIYLIKKLIVDCN